MLIMRRLDDVQCLRMKVLHSLPLHPSTLPPFYLLFLLLSRFLFISSVPDVQNKDLFLLDDNNSIIFAGIIKNMADISVNVLKFITRLNCERDVPVHIVASENEDVFVKMYVMLRNELYPSRACAPLLVVKDSESMSFNDSRIDRITRVREFQRGEIASVLTGKDLNNVAIILADLDLVEMPTVEKVMGEASNMLNHGGVDVLCSAGIYGNSSYYDLFATILLPDTFVYRLESRMIGEAGPDEDKSLIVGESFSREDLLAWFIQKGQRSAASDPSDQILPAMAVPVRSCFGGLALYRAEKWLNFRCKYTNSDAINNKYANQKNGQPCEHVVLHNCLKMIEPTTVIAVQPDMRTIWHRAIEIQYAISKFVDLASTEDRLLRGRILTNSGEDGKRLLVSTSTGGRLLRHRNF